MIELTTQQQIAVYQRAREIIARTGKLSKITFARDASGLGVNIEDERAVYFCARGAECRALFELGFEDWKPNQSTSVEDLLTLTMEETLGIVGSLAIWSNRVDAEEVIDGFDLMVATLKAAA